MKESAIVQKIIKAVKARYPRSYVRKLSDRFSRGLPDIIIVCPCEIYGSFFLAVECKTPSGRQSQLQKMEGDEINAIPGATYIVARSVEEVLAVMEENGAVV